MPQSEDLRWRAARERATPRSVVSTEISTSRDCVDRESTDAPRNELVKRRDWNTAAGAEHRKSKTPIVPMSNDNPMKWLSIAAAPGWRQ